MVNGDACVLLDMPYGALASRGDFDSMSQAPQHVQHDTTSQILLKFEFRVSVWTEEGWCRAWELFPKPHRECGALDFASFRSGAQLALVSRWGRFCTSSQ